jgi:hypothetical protein
MEDGGSGLTIHLILLDVESVRRVDGKHVALSGMGFSIERFGQQRRRSVGADLEMSITEYSPGDGRDTRQHHTAWSGRRQSS